MSTTTTTDWSARRAPVTMGRVIRWRELLIRLGFLDAIEQAEAEARPIVGPRKLADVGQDDAQAESVVIQFDALQSRLWEAGAWEDLVMVLFDVDEGDAENVPVPEVAAAVPPFVTDSNALSASLIASVSSTR